MVKKYQWGKMTVAEIGAAICGHLQQHGISVVLSGGACVSIYSANRYESSDLDFVMSDYSLQEIDPIMAQLDFVRTKYFRHYENKKCRYFIEFPPSPLTVGNELVTKTANITNRYGTLRLLRPVDSVKDRLAAFYHWSDRQSLQQAIFICLQQRINQKELERWSAKEGMKEKFVQFSETLLQAKKKK